MNTIDQCLSALQVTPAKLESCDDVQDEFLVIKRAYFQKALDVHPDKGGDVNKFQSIQTAFEILREYYDTCKDKEFSFLRSRKRSTHFAKTFRDFKSRPTPSFAYYSYATDAIVPQYRVELARSGRSSCVAKGRKEMRCPGGDASIQEGELRVGAFNFQSGSFGRWNHVPCWRVPMKIWLGLPSPEQYPDRPDLFEKALSGMNEVLLSGFSELRPRDKKHIVKHVMKRENWARASGKSKEQKKLETLGGEKAAGPSKTELVPVAETKIIPKPVEDAPSDALEGKTIVLTGRFPEVGGGFGLQQGKAGTKEMIESFGGRVTSAVSGKTDILLVGESPGFKQVTKAREADIPLITLGELVEEGIMEGNLSHLESSALSSPLQIQNFSPGFMGANYRQFVTPSQYAIAAGTISPHKKKRKRTKLIRDYEHSSLLPIADKTKT